MHSDWIKNEAATKRVKGLLLKAGIPLEIFVANVCRQFADDHMVEDEWRELSVVSVRQIYNMGDPNDTLREVDQVVEITSLFRLLDEIDVFLCTIVPIECKHRDNVEVFGFPYPDQSLFKTHLPMISELSSRNNRENEFISGLFGSKPIAIREDLSSVCLIEITNGKTPGKVFEENLVYKAGASLYDYILTHHRDTSHGISMKIAESLGIISEFERGQTNSRKIEEFVLDQWGDDNFRRFNTALSRFTNVGVFTFIPVICMDSPLHVVDFTEEGEILNFTSKDILLTDIVFSSWPGRTKEYLINPQANPMLVITHHKNVRQLLESVLEWHKITKQEIIQFSQDNPDTVHRMPLRTFIPRMSRKRTRS